MVADHGISVHDLKKGIKMIEKLVFLFFAIVFNMNLLAILQTKPAIIEESHS